MIQMAADSIAADSVAADSISEAGRTLLYGISLNPAPVAAAEYAEPASNAMSWIVVGLVVLFLAACLRYRKNTAYFLSIFHNVVEARERSSSYDSTVRESSFLLLLNIVWCMAVGILLYATVNAMTLHTPVHGWTSTGVGDAALCGALAVGYTLFMIIAYSLVGNVFADPVLTSTWVQGYLSSQAMSGVGLFPLAIIGFAVPASFPVMLILGAIIFVAAKFVFFYKGFCIFFSKSGSWVLFLYYLCSLEIVPLVLAYGFAAKICG